MTATPRRGETANGVHYTVGVQGRKDPGICAFAEPGPRLNIKTVLSMYGDFHVKDKTAVRTSYL